MYGGQQCCALLFGHTLQEQHDVQCRAGVLQRSTTQHKSLMGMMAPSSWHTPLLMCRVCYSSVRLYNALECDHNTPVTLNTARHMDIPYGTAPYHRHTGCVRMLCREPACTFLLIRTGLHCAFLGVVVLSTHWSCSVSYVVTHYDVIATDLHLMQLLCCCSTT